MYLLYIYLLYNYNIYLYTLFIIIHYYNYLYNYVFISYTILNIYCIIINSQHSENFRIITNNIFFCYYKKSPENKNKIKKNKKFR